MKFFLGFAMAMTLTVSASSANYQATSNFQLQLQFSGATQIVADNKRDAALVDFSKALGLDIY